MGLFRKKQQNHTIDETMDSTFHEEEVRKGRGLGKWVCGSKASKQTLQEDNKISPKNSYSSSTASSNEDKRDDRLKISSFEMERQKIMDQEERERQEFENSILASLPPPAAQAAFEGPPLFDWIDIEYHAATRVQKVFRRHLVLREMEQAGLSTSYMRNRKRERKHKAMFMASSFEAVPDFGFGCCSMSLAFGNEDLDMDAIAYNDFHRKRYEEKNHAQKKREEFLSHSYLEQKGIQTKAVELNESKFRDHSLLAL